MFPLCQFSGHMKPGGRRFCRLRQPLVLVSESRCLSCEYAGGIGIDLIPICNEPEPKSLDCIYRGAEIDTKTCELCGNRGKTVPVYKCEKHGSCTTSRWTQGRTEIACCTSCRDLKQSVPDLPELDPTSNLIWHCWPRKEAESLWREQLDFINGHINQFTGKTYCSVAYDHSCGGIQSFLDEVRQLFDVVKLYVNDHDEREVPGWRAGMEFVQTQPGFTVFLHAKGVYRGCTERYLQRWWNLAYETMLDVDSVRRSLESNIVTGCFRRNEPAMNLGVPWHYSGSFYAVRNDSISFPPSNAGGWYAEAWPALIAKRELAGCLRFDHCKDLYQAENWKEGIAK